MALALDGTPQSGSTSGAATATVVTSSALVTTGTNDVIVALIAISDGTNARTVSSVSGGGLTWAKRSGISGTNSSFAHGDLEVWYATTTSTFNSTVTANLSGTAEEIVIVAFAASGANTTTPFDVNASLPATNSNLTGTASDPAATISTTNANCFLFAAGNDTGGTWNGGSAPTAPSGFTRAAFISGFSGSPNFWPNDEDGVYKIVSSTQSSLAITWGTTASNWFAIGDAIQAASAGGSTPTLPRRNIIYRRIH